MLLRAASVSGYAEGKPAQRRGGPILAESTVVLGDFSELTLTLDDMRLSKGLQLDQQA